MSSVYRHRSILEKHCSKIEKERLKAEKLIEYYFVHNNFLRHPRTFSENFMS